MQIVTLNNTRYAIGLWWQFDARSGIGRARALARSLGGDYTGAVIRAGQFGLGTGGKAFRGLLSLAAQLADKGGSHLYVCRFDASLWWVCAIKDGVIAAEGDWIGASEAAARAQAAVLHNLLDLPEPVILAQPGEAAALVREDDSRKRRGLPVLPRKFRPTLRNRVQSLASPARRFAGAIAALALCFGLFWLYQSGWFTDDAATRAAMEARRREILAHPEKYFPRPWLKTPLPSAWAGRCLSEMLALPILDQGWELKSSICDSENLLATYDFSSSASFLQLPEQAELLTATTARKKTPLPQLAPGGDVKLLPRDEVAHKMYEAAKLLGLHLKLNWKPKAKQTVREGKLVVPLTSPWQTAEFTLSDVSPQLILEREFYQVLQSIPGLVVQEISHTGGRWELKGLCHGQ